MRRGGGQAGGKGEVPTLGRYIGVKIEGCRSMKLTERGCLVLEGVDEEVDHVRPSSPGETETEMKRVRG